MEIEKPKIGADGTYTDAEGEWTIMAAAARKGHLDVDTILAHLPEGSRTIEGRAGGVHGRGTVLYLRRDVEEAVRHITSITREIPTNGIYTTSSGRRYATLPVAAETLGISITILKNRTKNVATLKARIRNTAGRLSRVSALYCLEDFSEHPEIKGILAALTQESQTGYESGPSSDDWLTVDAFYNFLPVRTKKKTSKKSIRRQLVRNSCANKSVTKPGTRLGAKLYRREDLWQIGLRLTNAEIKVDRKTGFYRDRAGNRWATRDTWEKKRAVTGNALNYGMQKLFHSWENTPRIRGLGMVKREDWLYSQETIDKILAFIFEAEYQLRDGGIVYKLVGETYIKVQRVYANAAKIARQAHVSADQVRKRLGQKQCISIKAIHRRTGQEVLLHDLNAARRIFREQIMIKVEADDSHEVKERLHGRCVTLITFIVEQGREKDVKWRIAFGKLVKRRSSTKLRRRDPGTHRIFSYYPERDLARIAGGMDK